MTWVLWISILGILYTYAGYPVVLFGLSALKQLASDLSYQRTSRSRRNSDDGSRPSVAVLVAAHNEEAWIGARIRNVLDQTYPASLLRVYVGSDFSDDATDEILRQIDSARLECRFYPARRGKAAIIADLATMGNEEIIVFTDANTAFEPDAVENLVRRFQDPEVVCACGELRILSQGGSSNSDHVYWRYERYLKLLESRVGGLGAANGGICAIRRSAYRAIPANAIVDDFWMSMSAIERGGRCVYDPEAVAYEYAPRKLSNEFSRRVRIGAGNYQALVRFIRILHPRFRMVAFCFLSHKVIRWCVPFLMIAAFAANLVLAADGAYRALFWIQTLYYLSAGLVFVLAERVRIPALLKIPTFILGMNLALLLGFFGYVSGRTTAIWRRTERGAAT